MANIAAIEKRTKTVAVDLGEGETLNVTYRPAAYTPDFEARVNDAIAAGDRDALGDMLETLLLDWDLFEDEKQTKKVPIKTARIRTLPMILISPVLETVGTDLAPNRASAKASGAGSME